MLSTAGSPQFPNGGGIVSPEFHAQILTHPLFSRNVFTPRLTGLSAAIFRVDYRECREIDI